MSYVVHHVIVVTSWQKQTALEAHKHAVVMFGPLVSEPVRYIINDGFSFFVAPDGSKEGWKESEVCDRARDAFIEFLRGMEGRGLYVQWVEVLFGADEHGLNNPARVLRSSDGVEVPHGG